MGALLAQCGRKVKGDCESLSYPGPDNHNNGQRQRNSPKGIADRGPYAYGRVIDLSTAAAKELGMLGKGVGEVTLEIVSYP